MRRVRIGLLYSRSGTYRLLSEACRAGALRGVAAVNADPTLGLALEVVERDPGGEADAYGPACAEILAQGARHVVGCVTSWSRKEVIPTLERLGGVLWYACPYEGFEASSLLQSLEVLAPVRAQIRRYGGCAYIGVRCEALRRSEARCE